LHELLLPQQSIACHVQVFTCGLTPAVDVLRIVIVRLVPQQASTAVGASKFHGQENPSRKMAPAPLLPPNSVVP
jgi:hypothetical protein